MEVYHFNKGDRITAERLNSLGNAIICLQTVGSQENSVESTMLNSIPASLGGKFSGGFNALRAERLNDSNSIRYRDYDKGTGDLPKGATAGFFAGLPAIADAKGTLLQSPNDAKLDKLLSNNDIYLNITLNENGCFEKAEYSNTAKTPVFWNKKDRKKGSLSVKSAIATVNPARTDEPLALNIKPFFIPIIPRDYNPCSVAEVGTRQVYTYSLIDDIKGASVPVYGIATKGGMRISREYGDDKDLFAYGFETNVEVYALKGDCYNCLPCEQTISSAGDFTVYREYNFSLPFSCESVYKGGTVANWGIYKADPCGAGENLCCIGAISLEAQQITPWQIGFAGKGKIIIPDNGGAEVGTKLKGLYDINCNPIDFENLNNARLWSFQASCDTFDLIGDYRAGYLALKIIKE